MLLNCIYISTSRMASWLLEDEKQFFLSFKIYLADYINKVLSCGGIWSLLNGHTNSLSFINILRFISSRTSRQCWQIHWICNNIRNRQKFTCFYEKATTTKKKRVKIKCNEYLQKRRINQNFCFFCQTQSITVINEWDLDIAAISKISYVDKELVIRCDDVKEIPFLIPQKW